MKKNIFFVICFICFSCKGQEIILDVKDKDVIIFQDKKGILKSTNLNSLRIENIIINPVNWAPIGSNHNINKYFSFYDKQDTMIIKCRCGQERNYYFKNLEFKKGNYELIFDFPKIKILFQELENSKKIQNIFLKNTYMSEEEIIIKDSHLKDLKFYEIDLNDTINVKLRKMEDFPF